MPRRARVDWDAVSAAAPLGQIRVRDLLALGVPSSTIADRCAANGMWWRPLSGTASLTRGVLTEEQRIANALLYAGADAVLTGAAACRRFGLTRAPAGDEVHLLVPHATRRRSQSFALVERTCRLPKPRVRKGVPCAPLPRAVLDAARRLTRLDEVRALLAEAVQRHLTTVSAMRAELQAGSGRGSAIVRRVLVELADGVQSVGEAWCREVVAEMHGFPPVLWNARLFCEDGRFLVIADGFVDGVALAIEVHSFAHHADPDAFDDTIRRQARMTAAGVIVVPVTPRQLRDEPEEFRRRLWEALEQARVRPRPPIRVA